MAAETESSVTSVVPEVMNGAGTEFDRKPVRGGFVGLSRCDRPQGWPADQLADARGFCWWNNRNRQHAPPNKKEFFFVEGCVEPFRLFHGPCRCPLALFLVFPSAAPDPVVGTRPESGPPARRFLPLYLQLYAETSAQVHLHHGLCVGFDKRPFMTALAVVPAVGMDFFPRLWR